MVTGTLPLPDDALYQSKTYAKFLAAGEFDMKRE